MKKVLYLLLAFTIANASLIAGHKGLQNKYGQAINVENVNSEPAFNDQNVLKGPVLKNNFKTKNNLLGVDNSRYTNLVNVLGNSSFNWNYERETANPISYDPTFGDKGMIAIMNMEPDYAQPGPGGGGGPYRLTLSMYYSLDGGFNWTTRDSVGFYPTTPFYYTAPTIGITNTDQSQEAVGLESGVKEEFDYVIYARNYSSTEFTYSGMGMFINLALESEPFVSDFRNPEINNSPDPQMWGFASSAASSAVGNSGIYFVSMMSPDPFSEYQYGYYGNIGLYTSTGGEIRGNSVQPQWWADKFRPSTALGSSFQNRPVIDTDPNGNVYVASNNFFSDDTEVRIPAVWKSTNGGQSFSDPNRCPVAVIDEVAGTLADGADDWFPINYSLDAFVAYGDDQYSYFMRVVSVNAADENIGLHILEVNYTGGVWSARKVSDISENIGNGLSLPTWLSYNSRIATRFGFTDSSQVPLMEEVNLRGHELEASVTADGSALVVKYLDWAGSKTVTFKGQSGADTSYTYYREGLNEFGLEDTIPATAAFDLPNDIFISTRNISDNSWGEEYNVTNDNWNYKATFMPKVVPSLSEIPIAVSNNTIITNPASSRYHSIGKLNLSFWSQVSWFWFQDIDAILLDGTKNAPEGNSAWMSVRNDVNKDFELFDPFPNPTSNETVEISFNLNTNGFARVSINDAMGRTVAVPFEGQLASGMKGINFNTANFATGTYYINLTVGNNTATKILNVIK